MKKIITGGTGLIGSHFSDGIKLNSSHYNLMNQQDVIRMYEEQRPDVVIHTAAKVGGLGANIKYPADFYYDNIIMNTNVIHYAKEFGVKKLICLTSTCVFPDEVEYPLTEEKIHLGPPNKTNFAYAYAKRMADVQIEAYNEQYNTNYFSIIPANVYGPNDNFNIEQGHVVPGLIHKFYLATKNNTDVEIWGSGNAKRELVHAKDVARVCEILEQTYSGPKPVIITTSEEIAIRDLAYLIADIFKFKNKINFNTDRPDGQMRKPSSNAHLKSLIKDFEFTPLRDGLEETIEWFKANYETLRK